MFTAREEYVLRQKRKSRRRTLWHRVLEHYRIGAKWGLDPIPRQRHLQVVLLLQGLRDDIELWQQIDERQKREDREKRFNIEEQAG